MKRITPRRREAEEVVVAEEEVAVRPSYRQAGPRPKSRRPVASHRNRESAEW